MPNKPKIYFHYTNNLKTLGYFSCLHIIPNVEIWFHKQFYKGGIWHITFSWLSMCLTINFNKGEV